MTNESKLTELISVSQLTGSAVIVAGVGAGKVKGVTRGAVGDLEQAALR